MGSEEVGRIGTRNGGLGKATESQNMYDRTPERIPARPMGLLLLPRIRMGSEPAIPESAMMLLLLTRRRGGPQHLWIKLWITFCDAGQPSQTYTITE